MVANKFKILFMFGVCNFLPSFIGRSIDLSLPAIGKEFNMTIISLSWVITAYLLATAVLVLPFGRLADIVGRKKIFILGSMLFTITTLLCGLAYSGTLLITARVLQGTACAMIFGTANALLVAIFPPKERGHALGISVACVYLGSSLGPSLGGIMTQYLGWRSVFFMITILSTIVVAMAFAYLNHEKTESHGEPFDFVGSLLYALSVVALLLGTTMLPAVMGYLVIATGMFLFVVFCTVEDYIKHPVFDVNLLLKNKAFAMSNLAALLNFSAAFGVPFLISLFLQYIKGMSPQNAGLIILASPIMMVIGSPIAGKLSDKIDPRIVASIGMALISSALLIMSIVASNTLPLYWIVILLMLFGTGATFFASPNMNSTMSSVSTRHLGIAGSVINTMRLFGQTVSMGITTLVLTLYVGKVEISNRVLPQLMGSIRVTLLVFSVLCLIGVFASLARGRRQENV
jgi:EmrB/QacA subfamily drug resistance transporter